MKTAIYIEDGDTQLVLTPENDWERNVVKSISDGSQSVAIHRGEFYECRGGWLREGGQANSLIIRMKVNASQEKA